MIPTKEEQSRVDVLRRHPELRRGQKLVKGSCRLPMAAAQVDLSPGSSFLNLMAWYFSLEEVL